jgi:AcrR family transcriptional regulator
LIPSIIQNLDQQIGSSYTPYKLTSQFIWKKIMPKLKPETSDARKEHILQAALTCFAREGFHRTSVDAIVEAASLSKGSLYTYYSSKTDLYLALLGKLLSDTGLIGALNAHSGSSRQRLDAAMRSMLSFTATPHYLRYAALLMDAWNLSLVEPQVRRKLAANYSELRASFTTLIQSGVDLGEFNPTDAPGLANVFIAIFDGLMVQFMLDPAAVDWQAAARTIQVTWATGLFQQEEA